MQYQRINITLPKELAANLRRSVPARQRSKFISSALSEKLRKEKNTEKELIKSLKANAKLYREIAKDWEAVDLESWPE